MLQTGGSEDLLPDSVAMTKTVLEPRRDSKTRHVGTGSSLLILLILCAASPHNLDQ